MRYLALLYGKETPTADPTSQAFAEELARYEAFSRFAGEAVVGGEALEPSRQGVTVRHGPGGPVVTEGLVTEGALPETTEVVGGFFVLEAGDLDRAIELARRIPAAEDGAVELRPLVEWSEERRPLPAGARRWLALLAGEESEADQPGTPAFDAAVEAHDRFGREAGEAVLGGGALHPAETATVVRTRGGEVLVTEGTYAEATEVIGGLYLLQAPSREAAARLAARIPLAPTDFVQLRPVMELDG